MNKAVLIIICVSLLGCHVHRVPVVIKSDFEAKAISSIGILNCRHLEIDQSQRYFTRDKFDLNFVQVLRDSKLFTEVKCLENTDERADFIIEAKQLLKITDDKSCLLDNTMLMTIGTFGLISTGCTTYYETALLATDTKSQKQIDIYYKHHEDRRNGLLGYLSGFSKAWKKDNTPFPLNQYYELVALEIYKKISMSEVKGSEH